MISGKRLDSLAERDPVDHSGRVVAQVHRSIAAEYNPHRTPHPPPFLRFARRQPSGNEVFHAALRLPSIVKFNAHNFVSRWNAAIPRPMKCYEEVVSVLGGKLRTFLKPATHLHAV